MMYPYITIGDDIEVTHSQIIEEEGEQRIYVHFERPVDNEKRAFDEAECVVPRYEWKIETGFSADEMNMFNEFLHDNAHLFYRYAETGGVRIA